MIRRFEDLKAWQVARELARGVYRATQKQGLARDFALADQMKRAAASITGNTAEGYERGTRKQHIEFCYVAKGSAGELRSHVIIAHDVGLLDASAYAWLMEQCETCSRLLSGYVRSLERTANEYPGVKQRSTSARTPTGSK